MKNKIEYLFNVKKKIIVVVGGTRGIGAKIVQELLSFGSTVVTLGRTELKKKNHIKCSITNEKEIISAFNKIKKEFGKVDVLINVAGISEGAIKSKKSQNISDFKNILETNLIGVFKVCNISKKFLKKGSSIINVSSIASQFGFPNNPGYIASKSGLSGLTRSLAYDLSKFGIRVNNLIPGYIKTNMTIQSYKNSKLYNLRKSKTLLNRWGETKDLVGAVVFLSSRASNYVTGSNVTVDGGWSIKGI
jgi:NAD(P)-dependent dehydrogenase (short-subunit alcohol dehydrogenase family)